MQHLDLAILNDLRLSARKPAFFFDFDGTLVDIVSEYRSVVFDNNARDCLHALSRHYFVAVLTGRALVDITQLIDLSHISYAGNHGLEIYIPPHIVWQHQDIPFKQLIQAHQQLSSIFSHIPGVSIENKNASLAIHFRQAEEVVGAVISEFTQKVLRFYPKLLFFSGKKVVNICPNILWDKGSALKKILRHHKLNDCLPIFFGDDCNDEPAFAQVNRCGGISVYVGEEKEKTCAKFYVNTPKDVMQIIKFFGCDQISESGN